MQVPAAKIYFPEVDKGDILAKVEEVLTTGQLTFFCWISRFFVNLKNKLVD